MTRPRRGIRDLIDICRTTTCDIPRHHNLRGINKAPLIGAAARLPPGDRLLEAGLLATSS